MLPKRLSTTFAVLLVCAFTLPQTQDEFTAYGWKTATINGVTYVKANGDVLPSGWACDVEGTAVVGSCSKSAGLRGYQTGPIENATFGEITPSFKVKTSKTVPPTGDTMVQTTFVANSEAFARVTIPGGYASGSGKTNTFTDAHAYVYAPGEMEVYDGPSSRTIEMKALGAQWTTESDGRKSAVFSIWMPGLNSAARARGPGGGGNMVAISSSGSSSCRLQPLKISFATSGPGTVSGMTHPFIKLLCIDIYNQNNALLSLYGTNVVNGESTMTFEGRFPSGNYRLYVFTDGTLRKRVDISYDAATGLSGLDYTLKYGDLDGDNFVSPSEVQYIYNLIGTDLRVGNNYFGDLFDGRPYRPFQADFNGDWLITAADYNLAAPNSGLYGD